MARGKRTLCAECGAEGVDCSKGCCAELAFELTAHSEGGWAAEEVFAIVDSAVFGAGKVVEWQGCYLEHSAGTFAVTAGDERSVQIEETFVVEELVDSESEGATDAQDSAESSGTRTQVSLFAQELHCMSFLLQGVGLGVGSAVYFESIGLYLACPAFTHRLNELSGHMYRRAGGNGFEFLVAETREVEYNLQIAHRRTIVESHELYVFVASAVRTQPFTSTSEPISAGSKISLIFVLFIVVSVVFLFEPQI